MNVPFTDTPATKVSPKAPTASSPTKALYASSPAKALSASSPAKATSPAPKAKHKISGHTVWLITKIVVVCLILGLIIYAIVKYWKYVEIAGLVLGGLLAAAALAPILLPILAGLAGLTAAGMAWAWGKVNGTKEISDQLKADGQTDKANAGEQEVKSTIQSDTEQVNKNIVDAQNQNQPNVDMPGGTKLQLDNNPNLISDAKGDGEKSAQDTFDDVAAAMAPTSQNAAVNHNRRFVKLTAATAKQYFDRPTNPQRPL